MGKRARMKLCHPSVRASTSLRHSQLVTTTGELGELVEAPGTPISDAPSDVFGYPPKPQKGPAHSAGHGRCGVHVATHGDSRADRLPVIVRVAQEGVQAPQHAARDERCYAPLFLSYFFT